MMNIIPYRWRRASVVFIHDIVMASVAFVVSMYLRVGNQLFTEFDRALWPGLPLFVLSCALCFRAFGMYKGVWRYASMPDLTAIIKAVTAAMLLFVLLIFLLTRLDDIPRSLPLIGWFVLTIFLGGPRFAYRLMKDRSLAALQDMRGNARIPVLLFGAREGAELFIRAMMTDHEARYRVVGIIDDKGSRVGYEILGVPVMGGIDDIGHVVEKLTSIQSRPQRLIITKTHQPMDGTLVSLLLDEAEKHGLTLARLPSLTDFRDAADGEKITPRPVAVEDLLGRCQKNLDREAISALIRGKKILVTGAGGTIGSELVRQIAALAPAVLVLVDHAEYNLYQIDLEMREKWPDLVAPPVLCDVRDAQRVTDVFDEWQPNLVFHAAALKHVPMVEMHPSEGILTNIIGTRNIAQASRRIAVGAMVMISTDKAVHPTSMMGASKRMAEIYCQALDLDQQKKRGTRFVTVRFGNVLGSTGSVVPLFERQLRRGGPLTVTHPDVSRYFMTCREAVQLVLQASAYAIRRKSEQGKILMLDMGQPMKIVDLARQMIRLAGLRPDIDVRIEYTGLRPGEKICEDLYYEHEPVTQTEAEGILVVAPTPIDLEQINKTIDNLEQMVRQGDQRGILTQLGEWLPSIGQVVPPAEPPLPITDNVTPLVRRV
jgi:O-antigen biosynthesis protein WbqV